MLFDVLIRPAARVRCRTARIGLQYGAAGLVGKVCVVCICGWEINHGANFSQLHTIRAPECSIFLTSLVIKTKKSVDIKSNLRR
jgi:hypothetical protein